MKVIFTEDVPNVAKSGQMKDVADGYARNYLIPRKLAVFANSGTIKAMAAKMEARIKADAQAEIEMKDLGESLNGKEIFIEAKSGGKERLYGSVTSSDIATELEKVTGLEVDKRKIKLLEAIHQLGTYDVEIRLSKDVTPKIKVTVMEIPPEETE
ncbi:MAG: 50S ribosomal protein L9 [Dehalococcoidales bacterium]|nr:MAG: 50S ribosomal protein L9 [Dehalococcoidales bacterium]